MPTYSHPGVYVEEVPSAVRPIAGVGTSTAGFIGVAADIKGPWDATKKAGMPLRPDEEPYVQAEPLIPQPINSWTDFTQAFGDLQPANQFLAHAVYGFFNNGGSRCWVTRLPAARGTGFATSLDQALRAFEGIDEIAIVAAPLPPDTAAEVLTSVQTKVVEHCENMQDRVAILDSGDTASGVAAVTLATVGRPAQRPKGYGAFYFPWIEVTDPLGDAGAVIVVPPSGHLAGVYARSDAERGVHKAPANEVLRGALGVRYQVSKILQDELNPAGVNCIRSFGGSIKVYGARTLASDSEWTYINVRRLVNFLRESIDEGTQWVVFEPNAPELWSRIRRNVGAFLNGVWASGALLGATADQAYYVRCDETTNPPEVREPGQVVTEIGVAIVRPAEFVIFRLSQWAGPGQ